eukprot:12412506-Alexandrium_andersonii.AAC.1
MCNTQGCRMLFPTQVSACSGQAVGLVAEGLPESEDREGLEPWARSQVWSGGRLCAVSTVHMPGNDQGHVRNQAVPNSPEWNAGRALPQEATGCLALRRQAFVKR